MEDAYIQSNLVSGYTWGPSKLLLTISSTCQPYRLVLWVISLGIISLYSGTLSIAYPSDQKKILLYPKYSIICNEIYWLYIQWVLETIFLHPQYSCKCYTIKSASLYFLTRCYSLSVLLLTRFYCMCLCGIIEVLYVCIRMMWRGVCEYMQSVNIRF